MLIIECKTWGEEHDTEKQKTAENGGQIFGYLQQDRAATHLCIYSSHLAGDKIEYRSDIIQVEDTPEAQEKFGKREKSESHTAARDAVPLFRHAHNRESLHHVWKTTYASAFQSSGLFEDDFTPYAIGYLPKRGKDLAECRVSARDTRRVDPSPPGLAQWRQLATHGFVPLRAAAAPRGAPTGRARATHGPTTNDLTASRRRLQITSAARDKAPSSLR